jgi:hypothetical protein
MTRLEKIELAIKKGYVYNPYNGKIFGPRGKEITRTKNGYICIEVFDGSGYNTLYGHQLAYYMIHKEVVKCIDHRNHCKTDNRIDNLRAVTQQQNQFNRKNVKGYSFCKKTNRYEARIIFNSKNIYLGCFNTPEEARQAYLDAKKIYHVI